MPLLEVSHSEETRKNLCQPHLLNKNPPLWHKSQREHRARTFPSHVTGEKYLQIIWISRMPLIQKTSKHVQSCVTSQLWSKCGEVKFNYLILFTFITQTSITAEDGRLHTAPKFSSGGAQSKKTRCSEPLRQPLPIILHCFKVRLHLSWDLRKVSTKSDPIQILGRKTVLHPSTFYPFYPFTPPHTLKAEDTMSIMRATIKSGKITKLAKDKLEPLCTVGSKMVKLLHKEYGIS